MNRLLKQHNLLSRQNQESRIKNIDSPTLLVILLEYNAIRRQTIIYVVGVDDVF